jgi:hypothetical protein
METNETNYCVVCFKQKPEWRKKLFTCGKKCSNARNWQTLKQRAEGLKKAKDLDGR